MKPQLTSIEHGPVSLPHWQLILDDLGHSPVRRVARVLGIGERTVYRYNQTGRAPRVALLALFWLTTWGRHSVHAQATNDAMTACGLVEALRSEVRRLELDVSRLLALGDTGAANEPLPKWPHGGS